MAVSNHTGKQRKHHALHHFSTQHSSTPPHEMRRSNMVPPQAIAGHQ